MARPKGTYVSQVFNFGVDKRIPFGFVNLVIDREGNTVGFEKNGKFYNLGDKVPAPAKKPLTSDQLDKKKTLLTTKLALVERQASNTNIGESERNRYIAEFGKTQDELAATEQAFVETQIREGKIKRAEAEAKVAETIRFDLDRLEQRKDLLTRLGKSTAEVDATIQDKNLTLASLQTNEQPISGPDAARRGLPSSVLPKTPDLGFSSNFEAETPTTPTPEVDVKNPKVPKTPWTPDKLRKAIRNDVWYKKNSQEIKERYVQYYNYRDLQASGQAQGTTEYEIQIDKIEANLRKRAVQIGSAAASDPAALRKAAENLYITNRSEDQSFIDDFLAASIRTVSGMIGGKVTEGYTGQALDNYQELLRTARDNGLKISDIIPGGANEQQVLQGIASGKLDINRIIQDARKLAAQGQPQYVRDLLSQGYNLNQVFAPYRQTMAAVLEIDDPNSIDLNDPLLRSAISDKGDMNVYEFKKALRKDNRWQYTEQARQDVSSATLDILRDFGFQG
jgi:hypothetical protein